MQDLLEFVAEAEKGGFNSCLTSDHFHPWWHDNGYGNWLLSVLRICNL
jgi:coenzyme F420-dependent glucose-6-phosphate dehydrogenase